VTISSEFAAYDDVTGSVRVGLDIVERIEAMTAFAGPDLLFKGCAEVVAPAASTTEVLEVCAVVETPVTENYRV